MLTWDQVKQGDVVVIIRGTRCVPLTLLQQLTAENWKVVCACSNPDCPRTTELLNVRSLFANKALGAEVWRGGNCVHEKEITL